MIVWIKKEATGRPNDQRAEIVRAEMVHVKTKLHVIMCGDKMPLVVSPADICRVELPIGDTKLTMYVSIHTI